MSTPIMATKLYIPKPRPQAVLRPRLTQRLSKGLYRKLTLISAPAGYGKTTLVGEWLAECGRPAAWLSLEEGDNELARFITCMIFSLRTLEGNIGEGALAMLQTPQPPPAESILTVLLNELAALPNPFILVLDDYHAAMSAPVDDAVFFLLDHLPAQMHLVLTTRADPGFSLARLRVRDQLTELRVADLRFTRSESEAYLNRVMSLNLSADIIASLESRTEGWVAGLHLAALSIQEDRDADRLIQAFNGSHPYVLDYLVEEVLQRQPEAVQAFLLRTSILDRLCGSLCDDLMLDPSVPGKDTLMELERKNLFVVSLDNERRWYRYHHLFADLLRRRLEESVGGSRIAEWHKRAAVWYEANGFDIEAFRHSAESRDIERAARLLEGNGLPLHLRGAAGLALNWLKTLPAAELDARPSLWVIYGSALLMAGRLTDVESKLQAAETTLAGEESNAGVRDLLGLIAATRATLASLESTGHPYPGGADRKLRAAEAVMENAPSDDKTEELVGLIAPSSEERINGGWQETDRIIEQSRLALAYLRPDNLPVRTAAAWMLGVACQRRGIYPSAREAYNEVISNSRIMDHRLMAVMAMIGLGQVEEAEGQTDSAAEFYREALRLAGDLPLPALREARLGLERLLKSDDGQGSLIEPLSRRELEVLELIAQGLSNREIGEKLFLALDTVKGHNRRIFEKLQVQRRTEAIARAREWNLIPNTRKPH
ncbi:LuxR C-terminal-related transcriptional regulator [Cohnella thailandensis]|uniref:LuxR family transcriptional regulator n=1 Tax=Cohnella thailandensis TaxID=557557 RepID=A0A841SQ89_9BACL|nr:LuxR C-terminal-related transcriptional regulator [Cohnella thailandensis]MBB6633362.1 LuxR family transcriptional regulator [Cohnella thailandensis]MBP1977296.1 LuxR family maltose regulon positive regulatory protein [Cohnella thailandensis]